MNYADLIASITQVFVKQDEYFFDKHVPEFQKDGKFLGDYFNQLAVEPLGERPPRFYHTFSPFDVISGKAPHRAVIFESGEMLLNIDFVEYVKMRTAAMSAVVLKALKVDNLEGKRVLLFGSGKAATQAAKILQSEFGLKALDVINKSGDLTGIKSAVDGVEIKAGSVDDLGMYDVIICHTNASEPVISEEQIGSIKQGAVIASFISSTEHGEFPDTIFDSQKANIIADWQQTLLGAKDLKRATESGLCTEKDIIYLEDLLKNAKVDEGKQYTVYRSTGTPIQNLAVLKLLVQ